MTIKIEHLHLTVHVAESEALDEISKKLTALAHQQTQTKDTIIMAISAAEQRIVDRFNAETTRIANLIRDLLANPPADDTEFNTVLEGIAAQLEAVGAPPATT